MRHPYEVFLSARFAAARRKITASAWMLRLALGLALAVSASLPALAASPSEPPMKVDAANKEVRFSIALGIPGPNQGININGYSTGGITLTVPLGWRVSITAADAGRSAHSLEIVDTAGGVPSGAVEPAFAGAATKDLRSGLPPKSSDTFSFTADRAGRYRMMSAAPDDADGGMWGWFVVSATALTPDVSVSGFLR